MNRSKFKKTSFVFSILLNNIVAIFGSENTIDIRYIDDPATFIQDGRAAKISMSVSAKDVLLLYSYKKIQTYVPETGITFESQYHTVNIFRNAPSEKIVDGNLIFNFYCGYVAQGVFYRRYRLPFYDHNQAIIKVFDFDIEPSNNKRIDPGFHIAVWGDGNSDGKSLNLIQRNEIIAGKINGFDSYMLAAYQVVQLEEIIDQRFIEIDKNKNSFWVSFNLSDINDRVKLLDNINKRNDDGLEKRK